jgi:diguanylate cyclase (GGDEF)-like protein/PAS domain S-box-containing protein
MQQRTGYPEAELIGQDHRILNSGYHPAEHYERLWRTISAGQIWKGMFRNRDKAGSHYWVNATIVPFTDAWGKVTRHVCLGSDISDAIKLSEQLENERRLRSELARLNATLLTHANTDPLTGLSNRRGFDHFAQEALAASRQLARPMSVLMLDLDHFKQVNDTHGHAAGDAVLQEMARRWSGLIRGSDLLARLGGEEFCLLLPNTTSRQARQVAEKLRQACAASPVEWSSGEMQQRLAVTVSIGLALVTDAATMDQRLRQADEAMYQAKHEGRNRVSG